MNCFIQHYSPHSQLITKNCSSVSHFYIVAKSRSLQCIFTAYILLFLHYSTAIRYVTSFPKIPNFNLVKKLADWTISAVPSIYKLTECLHSSSGLLSVHGSVRFERQVCRRSHVRAQTHTFWWETGGQLWAIVTRKGCREVSVPPGRPQCTRHTASMSTDSDRNPVIPQYGKQSTIETLKLLWRVCLRCFLSRHDNQIILNCAALGSLAHSLSLLR